MLGAMLPASFRWGLCGRPYSVIKTSALGVTCTGRWARPACCQAECVQGRLPMLTVQWGVPQEGQGWAGGIRVSERNTDVAPPSLVCGEFYWFEVGKQLGGNHVHKASWILYGVAERKLLPGVGETVWGWWWRLHRIWHSHYCRDRVQSPSLPSGDSYILIRCKKGAQIHEKN